MKSLGGGKRGQVLDLVPPTISEETVHTLEILLAKARLGDVNGIIYLALGPGGAYEGDIAGTALEMPVFVRGLLPELERKLGKIIDSNK